MRKLYLLILILSLASRPVLAAAPAAGQYSDDEYNEIFAAFRSREPSAFRDGEFVVVLRDTSRETYVVRNVLTGETFDASRSELVFPAAPPAPPDASRRNIEGFANLFGFSSGTPYFVMVDVARQKTYVFHGSAGCWTLIKTFVCSTGSVESPTTKGFFTISARGDWFYSARLGSGARFWLRFNDSYLFHSIAMDKNRQPLPENNQLGERLSNGCVRLSLKDIEWLYRNVPDNSGVYVN